MRLGILLMVALATTSMAERAPISAEAREAAIASARDRYMGEVHQYGKRWIEGHDKRYRAVLLACVEQFRVAEVILRAVPCPEDEAGRRAHRIALEEILESAYRRGQPDAWAEDEEYLKAFKAAYDYRLDLEFSAEKMFERVEKAALGG